MFLSLVAVEDDVEDAFADGVRLGVDLLGATEGLCWAVQLGVGECLRRDEGGSDGHIEGSFERDCHNFHQLGLA